MTRCIIQHIIDLLETFIYFLILYLVRRRKYDGFSSIDLVRALRNMDQHFHDQTDEAILALRRVGGGDSHQWLHEVKQRPTIQRIVISFFISEKFPVLFLSLWKALKEIDSQPL